MTSVPPTNALIRRFGVWLQVVRVYQRSALHTPFGPVSDGLPLPHPVLGLFSFRMQSSILPSFASSLV